MKMVALGSVVLRWDRLFWYIGWWLGSLSMGVNGARLHCAMLGLPLVAQEKNTWTKAQIYKIECKIWKKSFPKRMKFFIWNFYISLFVFSWKRSFFENTDLLDFRCFCNAEERDIGEVSKHNRRILHLQGSGEGVSAEEKGVREMFGEPGGRAGEPE